MGESVEAGPRIGMDSPGGSQGSSEKPSSLNQWQEMNLLFRVPSPGRMTIALRIFNHQSGKVWLDDIQLQQQKESAAPEIATINGERIGKRTDRYQAGWAIYRATVQRVALFDCSAGGLDQF